MQELEPKVQGGRMRKRGRNSGILWYPDHELKTEVCLSCTQIIITLLCTHALFAALFVSGISILASV